MICVPIVSSTMADALSDIAAAQDYADVIELRLDLISDYDLPELLKAVGKPCIVTNRSKVDGGQFKGSEEERVQSLREAIELGADYIDIETVTPSPLLRSILESPKKCQVILSHHDFMGTPTEIGSLYEIMRQTPAAILKIVPYARDINDNITLFQLLERAGKDKQKIIAFCMGEKGEVSRILSPLLGGFLTFGSLETGKESAPGQIPASTLRNIYRAHEARPGKKIFGVIGDPVAKSLGYLIHNRAFQKTGLPHVYVPFWVANLEKFFPAFQEYFEGLSVTMPHKEGIIRLMDRVDPAAQKIGAVNTVVREGDQWVGHNTDCIGALKALEEHGDLKGRKVLIIGAGGAAKAIGHGVSEKGAALTITYNRNKEKGEQLAQELDCKLISLRDIDQAEIDLLINCSPAGMSPDTGETPFPARLLKKGMIVFDSVYNPMETRLMKEAKEAGCITISGVELFINQAAAQFELWTGQQAPIEDMREVVIEKLSVDAK